MRFFAVICAVIAVFSAKATHIVGGEMLYDFLGKNAGNEDIYRVTLRIYRDCLNGQAQFDGISGANALLTIRATSGELIGVHDIGVPVVVNVPRTINSNCIQAPTDVCLEEGTYTYTITLPPRTGGYYLIYQRCCRNNTIANLVAPGDQGSTYYTKIPGPEEAVGNSSPRFKKFPPIFLCGNVPFTFDHSATDPDGDKLVYSFYTPFQGADKCCPAINSQPSGNSQGCTAPPPSCPQDAPPPPYLQVLYASPYSAVAPMDANPALAIDPGTGRLTGKPRNSAQYVVGVCVREYRNGVLINTHFRDFQFNIRTCVITVLSDFAEPEKKCRGTVLTFTNESIVGNGTPSFHWDFGVPNDQSDTSNLPNPTFAYQDTGKYVVSLVTNPGKVCADTMRKLTLVYPKLDIRYPPVARQCLKDNYFTYTASGNFITETAFLWTFDTSAVPKSAATRNSNVIFKAPGLYTVTLAAWHYSCRDSFADTVRVMPRPKARIRNLPSIACSPGTIVFSNGSESLLPVRYNWFFSDGSTSSESNPSHVFKTPGIYSADLLVTTTVLCADTSIALYRNFTVNPSPEPHFTATPRVTSIFEPEIRIDGGSQDGVKYSHYEFGDGSKSFSFHELHTYEKPGKYALTQYVTNYFDCTGSATDTIRILPEFRFWAPSAFTPDGNSLNDQFKPVMIGVSSYIFEVYDRWGNRIFLTHSPEQGWNGTYQGKLCKQDIYVWRVRFKNAVTEDFEVRTGHVMLLPNP